MEQMRLGIEALVGELRERAARAPPPEQAGGSGSFGFGDLGGLLRSPSRDGGSGGGGAFNILGVQDIKPTFPSFGDWTRREEGGGGGNDTKRQEEDSGSKPTGDVDSFQRGRQKDKDKDKEVEQSSSRRRSSRTRDSSRRDKSEERSYRRSKSVPPSQGESGTA